MNYTNAIEQVRIVAAANPAVSAVLHVFAQRQRTRGRITLTAIKRTMKKEGFKHSAKQYGEVLKLLADVGFGTLERSPKGAIRALKDVKVTFQSIGMLANPGTAKLESFKPRKRFLKLAAPSVAELDRPVEEALIGLQVTLTLDINGKRFAIPVPAGLTTSEVATLVTKLKAVA